MKEPELQSIFPVPIYLTNIDRPFTKQELKFVYDQKKEVVANDGNTSSKDNYILNRKEFKNIKNFIQKCCEDYVKKIVSPKNDLQIYITQSWLNFTETNQFHHRHLHPNSVISGVLYFDCNSLYDKIIFVNPRSYEQIKPIVDKYNIWNSETWWYPVETGKLIMFPSSTSHQVDTKKGNNTRISLAFNTFYKGTVGSNSLLTELIL
tara:strand:- start:209 stop:826 length:618 start_codon:yes stop_codon:yes gene_type:complete